MTGLADRLAVNQFMVSGLSLDELARWCRRNGVRGIGVFRPVLHELGPAAVRRVLDDHGITPTSVCVALGLVHPDPVRARELRAAARVALREAAELGAPLVVVAGGAAPGLPLSSARMAIVEAVDELAGEARELGGRVLLEPLHPALVTLSALTDVGSAAELTARRPELGLVLDIWHMWTDPDLTTVLVEGPPVDLVHLADWRDGPPDLDERAQPGEGVADVPALCDAIADSGFHGWWELEVLTKEVLAGQAAIAWLDTALAAGRTVMGGGRDKVEVNSCGSW